MASDLQRSLQWYYAAEGGSTGPLDDVTFRAAVEAGQVRADTLVWCPALPQWKPYEEVYRLEPSLPPPPVRHVRCIECGEVFAAPEGVTFERANVCPDCTPILKLRVLTGSPTGYELPLASVPKRFLADLLDGLLLAAIYTPLNTFLVTVPGFEEPEPDPTVMIFFVAATAGMGLVNIVITFAYHTWFVGRFGATLGKMALHIKIVRADGSRVSYPRALGRTAGEILSGITLNIGYLIAFFDPQRRTLHDHLCDTRVVQEPGHGEAP